MGVRERKQIFERLSEHRTDLKSLGVRRLGLFGSFVRHQQSSESDIDMLVEFRQGGKTFDNFMNLAIFLEDLFGRRVELVTLESLSPHIGPKILSEMEYAIVD